MKLSGLANDEAIAVFRMTDVDDVDNDTFDIRLALTDEFVHARLVRRCRRVHRIDYFVGNDVDCEFRDLSYVIERVASLAAAWGKDESRRCTAHTVEERIRRKIRYSFGRNGPYPADRSGHDQPSGKLVRVSSCEVGNSESGLSHGGSLPARVRWRFIEQPMNRQNVILAAANRRSAGSELLAKDLASRTLWDGIDQLELPDLLVADEVFAH